MQDASRQILNKAIKEAIAIESEQLKKDYDNLMILYNKLVETNKTISKEVRELKNILVNMQLYKNKCLSILDKCDNCRWEWWWQCWEWDWEMCNICNWEWFLPKWTNQDNIKIQDDIIISEEKMPF